MARTVHRRPTPSGRSRWPRSRSVLADVLDRDGGWAELAEAGLLGLAVPEAYGGEGLGLPEVGVLLRETGARAVHLPVWETLCCGALSLAGAGTDEQQAGPAARRRERRACCSRPRCARSGRPITGDPRDDVRRRHGHRPQDRRDVRRPGDPAAGHRRCDGDRPVVALVDVSDPGVTLLESGSAPGSRRTRSSSTAPRPSCLGDGRRAGCSPSATSPASASPRPASSPAPAT